MVWAYLWTFYAAKGFQSGDSFGAEMNGRSEGAHSWRSSLHTRAHLTTNCRAVTSLTSALTVSANWASRHADLLLHSAALSDGKIITAKSTKSLKSLYESQFMTIPVHLISRIVQWLQSTSLTMKTFWALPQVRYDLISFRNRVCCYYCVFVVICFNTNFLLIMIL